MYGLRVRSFHFPFSSNINIILNFSPKMCSTDRSREKVMGQFCKDCLHLQASVLPEVPIRIQMVTNYNVRLPKLISYVMTLGDCGKNFATFKTFF